VRLGRAVQQLADEAAGEDAVLALGDRAQGAGEAQAARDDARQLQGRGGDEPDPLAGVEVHLGEGAGALPDAVGHQLVVDLLAQLDELGDGLTGDEGQGLLAVGADVLGRALAAEPELQLLPDEPAHVRAGEEVPGGQAAGEVEDRRAHHHGVVDVEERRRREVGRDACRRRHLVDVRGVGRRGRGRRAPARELAVGGTVDPAGGVRGGACAVRHRLEELRRGGRAEGGVPHRGLGGGLPGASRRVALRLYPALAPSSHRRVLPVSSPPVSSPSRDPAAGVGRARPRRCSPP
jgi:hypothetical protein